jgi:hypothetical protein
MDWIQRNFKTLIYISFLVPILTVAFVSISHVTTWYGITNPMSWAIYLSVGIEIAALSALAAISAQMGRKVYFPFGIVTIIQFIGNIFFAYQYIDTNSEMFKDWVDLVDPVVSYIGVESGNMVAHKRFLSLFSGGMLPLISLSFLHMLVKFEEEEKSKKPQVQTQINIDELSREAGRMEVSELEEKYSPTEEDLKLLEQELIKINEQKFKNLEDVQNENETKVEETVVDVESKDNNSFNIEIVSQDNEENNNNDIDSTIQVEPDFYREEEADYDIDGDSVKPKRLVYTKNN